MTISLADQVEKCWAEHDADTAHAEALAAEMASLESTEQVIADMDRLDHERDVALLKKAKRPGNSVVHLN